MNKFVPFALLATVATFTVAPAAVHAADSDPSVAIAASAQTAKVDVRAGRMIYGANGQRIASAYRVTDNGTVQVILNAKLVSIPAETLSEVNGKITTSLTKAELSRAR